MSILTRDEIEEHLKKIVSVRLSKIRKHATEYMGYDAVFYLKKTQRHPVVVHPDWRNTLFRDPIEGVVPEKDNYKNTNLTEFPRLDPKSSSQCGCDVRIGNVAALDNLLVRIGAIQNLGPEQAPARVNTEVLAPHLEAPSEPGRETAVADVKQPSESEKTAAFADVEAAALQLADLPETEYKAVVAARIGQGRFRIALMSAWSNRCAVTGTNVRDLLRASHIKPWRDSDNRERLDAENGLLLVATLDAAFDAGLISFKDNGTMLFSPRLDPDPHGTLRIPAESVLTRIPSPRQKTFLDHHRKAVFR